jgi:hypothetical protein
LKIADWLAHAIADAEARGLPELKPLLGTLARSTQALRDADGEFRHPAGEHTPRETADDDGRRPTRPHDGSDTQ